jgi:type I restriction enzyme S subunit
VERQSIAEQLCSPVSRFQIEREATGASSSMQNIGQETVREIQLVIPPLPEQRAIVEYLDVEAAKIDTLIEKARRAIELMKEHRSALIASAVTGQIDVRDHASVTTRVLQLLLIRL